MVPRNARTVRNSNYWDAKRVAKSQRLVLLAIPEPTTRAPPCCPDRSISSVAPPDFIPG
jgi:hypothetical protein